MPFPPDSLYLSIIETYLNQFHIPADSRSNLTEDILKDVHAVQRMIQMLNKKFREVTTTHAVPADTSLIDLYFNQFQVSAELRPALKEKIAHLDHTPQKKTIIQKIEMPNAHASVAKISPSTAPSHEDITQEAEKIAAEKNSLPKLYWLWAEASFQLKHGRLPNSNEIVPLIGDLSKEKSVDKINWYLAESRLKLRKK